MWCCLFQAEDGIRDVAVTGVQTCALPIWRATAVNLGTGVGYAVLAVAEAARRVTGRGIPAVAGPRRPGDPPELVAAAGRAATILGWRPRHSSLEEILASAWAWHQAHPHGYGN